MAVPFSLFTVTINDLYMNEKNKYSVKKLDANVIPFIIFPLIIVSGTVSSTISIFLMAVTNIGVLLLYSTPLINKWSKDFFVYWTCSSSIYLLIFYFFNIFFMNYATVLENITVLILVPCTAFLFYKMKIVADSELELGSSQRKDDSNKMRTDINYCHICKMDVPHKLFHSKWWNCCISISNYIYFMTGNIFAFITLLYCLNISLALPCDIIVLNDFVVLAVPYRCTFQSFGSSFIFSCCMNAIGYVGLIAFVLLGQFTVLLTKFCEFCWRKLTIVWITNVLYIPGC